MSEPHEPRQETDGSKSRRPAVDSAVPAMYQELRRIAKQYLRGERPDHTLQPTALVHEAYLRLVQQHKIDWTCRAQVLGVAARMMRRILVNYAVAHNAQKRGAALCVTSSQPDIADMRPLEIEELDSALNRLEEIDPRQAHIVELRFFSGLTIEETASVVEVSPETVKREWRTARLWLARELDGRKGGTPRRA
ncbi:MAG: ECF-type sigma factor [Bryobacteraceae bacterium]